MPSQLNILIRSYKSLFLGMDLRNFYFSFTYNLTQTLQHNYLSHDPTLHYDDTSVACIRSYGVLSCSRFSWNEYLLQPLKEKLSNPEPWILPTIQGYYQQQSSVEFLRSSDWQRVYYTRANFWPCIDCQKVQIFCRNSIFEAWNQWTSKLLFNNSLDNMMLAGSGCKLRCHRTSYHWGRERAQICTIFQYHATQLSPSNGIVGFVQMRGSIPLYWAQDPRWFTCYSVGSKEFSVLTPKPPIYSIFHFVEGFYIYSFTSCSLWSLF